MQAEAAQAFTSNKRYVIERELGHGGMGVVYQALDLERNTRVALKALTQRDALNIYRLKNEFRQLADLSHPNLVALHELCNEGNAWFFTMELVNGQAFDEYVSRGRFASPDPSHKVTSAGRIVREASITLSQRAIGSEFPMQQRMTCNIRRLRRVLRQLVEAVAALHDAGKLHRDLKPSNVLVTPEGRVVVLDFGLVSNSTFVDPEAQDAERTVGGCVFGTPAYMSPEQATGEAITTASDWYAVGTMMYEALTGQLPFDGTVLEILRQKETREPLPPSEIVAGVPDDLDQLCRALLHRDPRKRPSSTEILRAFTGHSDPPVIFDAQASRVLSQYGELFIGRERHVAELRDAFETTKSGKPVTVLVHGLSGMGKSALVRCFANELIRNEEAVVLRGRCYERESVPYKAFDNIIDALSRYLMRLPVEEAAQLLPRNVHALTVLFPVLKRVKPIAYARRPNKYQSADALELRNQAFAALKDLLLRITDHHPLVINIDDLQWADMDSARLLAFLMGPPDPPPLLLVGSYRRDEADNSPFLRQLLGERSLNEGAAQVRDLGVDALSESEAHHLASVLLRDLTPGNSLFASAIAAEAEGVPFFIAELVQYVHAHAERGALPVTMRSISLEQVVLERVAGMPPEAQRLLKVLSVAAEPLEQGVAIDAAGLPNGDRAATLALRAARLIRTRGTRQADKAETYHDRVRETVVKSMSADDVRNAHARIAHAMERYDIVDPERMVVHYSGAGDGVRAGETAVQAAHTAAKKLAFNRAAELYKRGIELLSESAPSRRELYEHLGDALANAGRGAQAAEAYLSSAADAEPAHARALERRAAQQFLRSGKLDQGMTLTARLLERVDMSFPQSSTAALVGVLWDRARVAVTPLRPKGTGERRLSPSTLDRIDTLAAVFKEVLTVDPVRGTLLHARFLLESLASREPHLMLQAIAWEAIMTAVGRGGAKRKHIAKLLEQVDELASGISNPYARATAQMARAACGGALGSLKDVEALAFSAEETFRKDCCGAVWETTYTRAWRYAAIELGGDLGILLREAPEGERDAREKGDDYAMGFLTLVVPMAHLMRDDAASAQTHLAEQQRRLGDGFQSFHLWVMDRRTDVYLYADNTGKALEYLQAEWPNFERSFFARAPLFKTNGLFLLGRAAARAARDTGRPEATKLAKRVAADLKALDRPDARAYAHLINASIARHAGQLDAAMRELCSAIEVCEAAHMRNFSIYARRNLGLLTRGPAGEKLVADADAAMRAMGILQPERWVDVYAPR
jgi:serine/threonine protein kinase